MHRPRLLPRLVAAPLLASAVAVSSAALAPQGFVNRTAALKLIHESATGLDQISASAVNDWVQRGLALGDIDGDGDIDLIACGGLLRNTVLRNDGGVFTDFTTQAGIEAGEFDTSPCLADIDLDGDLDLYIGVLAAGNDGTGGVPGVGRLYRNKGNGEFEDISALSGTAGLGGSLFAQWADLDNDGLLDLIVAEFYSQRNRFYRNNGDGTFRDLSAASGLDAAGSTHVTGVIDANGDGFLDVLVGNDWVIGDWLGLPNNIPDLHLSSQAGETWADVSAGSGYDHMRGIMGLAFGDVNYDGLLDVYKSDVADNRLAINQGWPEGLPWLGEEQSLYGIEAAWVPWHDDPKTLDKAVGWGVVFGNFDFDPWLDLFVVNGMIPGIHLGTKFSPRNQQNFLFTGDGPGAGFTFTDSTEEYGLFDEIDDRVVVVGDVEPDGDLDLFIQPSVGFLRYFENQVDRAGQGWLGVRPICQTSAPGGFGCIVRYTDSLGYPHVRQIGLDGVTAGQHENLAYFGLGTEPSVELTIEFPSGITLVRPNALPGQVAEPVEPKLIELSARKIPIAPSPGPVGVFNKPVATQPAELLAVTAYAHDQAGAPLGSDALVTIDAPGLTPLTDVLHVSGNVFRRYFEAPDVAGDHRVEVSFDGWTCRTRPRVVFYDPTDLSGTRIQVRPEAVRAGTTDGFAVTVAPRAASGVALGPGKLVSIDVPGATELNGAFDLGDGRYRATFLAPAAPGRYPVQVLVDGAAVDNETVELEAGGAIVNSTSELLIATPHPNTSAAPHQLKISFTPRDIDSNRIGPYVDVTLVPVPDPQTPKVVVRDDLHPLGQVDGEYVFIIEKPTTPPMQATGVLQVMVEGIVQFSIPYAF